MLRQIKDWVIQYVRSVLESTVRTAVVDSTDPANATVRVKIPDDDDLISYDLRVLARKTNKDQDYWMPDVGEHVLCLFLPYGLEQGFVLGAFYSKADKPPVSSQDKWHKHFQDGAVLEYDRKESLLRIQTPGDIKVEVGGDVSASVAGKASMEVGGDLEANVGGDIKADADGSIAATAGDQATVDAPLVKMNDGTGVITQESICHFTGNPHADGSRIVKAGK